MAEPGDAAPMLATSSATPFSADGWLFERKLDGVRAICVCVDGKVELLSRNGNLMNGAYPEIVDALAAQDADRFVVDGEIVAFDGAQTSFAMLQSRIHLRDPDRARATGIDVYLYLFDLLGYDGLDARPLPLRQRKKLLRDAFGFADPLRYSEHRDTDGEAYFAQACQDGWEGLIAKRAGSAYRGGRTRDWLKLKCAAGQEFVVGGFTDPEGARIGFGALLLGYYDGDALRYAGKVGTGYDDATLRDLRARLDSLERRESPFAEPVRERGSHWVAPELVVDVGFAEWTGGGKLRHPRFHGVRTDKAAADVVREG